MESGTSDLRSKMSKARGLGPAHHGVSHWWLQRVTALALLPLTAWFVYSLITVMLTPNITLVAQWFASSVNTLAVVLMLIALFLHAKLGVQVVIEDYVHGHAMKYTLLLLNLFVCFIGAATAIMAVLKLHLLDIVSMV